MSEYKQTTEYKWIVMQPDNESYDIDGMKNRGITMNGLEKLMVARDQCEGWMMQYQDNICIQTWAHKYFASKQEESEQEIERILRNPCYVDLWQYAEWRQNEY